MLTGSVLIDLKKAFGTVHHDLLIEKLSRYSVRDAELSCQVVDRIVRSKSLSVQKFTSLVL